MSVAEVHSGTPHVSRRVNSGGEFSTTNRSRRVIRVEVHVGTRRYRLRRKVSEDRKVSVAEVNSNIIYRSRS